MEWLPPARAAQAPPSLRPSGVGWRVGGEGD
jgi:hypothetical protein